jgi:anhydro-N-acetylmuramic acid kinase
MTDELIIGLMSGTSADGIDAVVVNFKSGNSLELVGSSFTAYPKTIQQRINTLGQSQQKVKPSDFLELDKELANLYANACLQLLHQEKLDKRSIRAIANHGQTIEHEPNASPPYSLQIGSGQIIADLTGIEVISQFRQADLEHGGQGAPLMPAFHKAMFKPGDSSSSDFIVNLGGIANISLLGETVIGFDTGPANTLLNQWIQLHQGKDYDDAGRWAKTGIVQSEVLAELMADPYLSLPFPKSTGPDYFNLAWLESKIVNLGEYKPEDVQATLQAFTVESIAIGIHQVLESRKKLHTGAIYICGGGAHNTSLLADLRHRLTGFDIQLTDSLGIPADWVESIGFAWLGYCYLHDIESNLPSVTGANRELVLGKSYLPNT